MAINLKGTRKIDVGDVTYRYKENLVSCVIIKNKTKNKQKLICSFPQFTERGVTYTIKSKEGVKKILDIQIYQVGFNLPKSFFREAILAGLHFNWKPDDVCKDLKIQLVKGNDKIYEFQLST